jgi:hypothetical protein
VDGEHKAGVQAIDVVLADRLEALCGYSDNKEVEELRFG